jgi:tRNA U38,U39,U40 pseudouridine synthase TruA
MQRLLFAAHTYFSDGNVAHAAMKSEARAVHLMHRARPSSTVPSYLYAMLTPAFVFANTRNDPRYMRAPRSFNAKNQCTGRRYQYLAPSYAFAPKGQLTEVRASVRGCAVVLPTVGLRSEIRAPTTSLFFFLPAQSAVKSYFLLLF